MRAIIIEDDKYAQKSVVLKLKSANITCDVFKIGIDKIETTDFEEYSIIILDLILPDTSGKEILIQIRNMGVKTPVIALSALSKVEHKIEVLDRADDYLQKPFHGDELIARIKAIVRRSKGYTESLIKIANLTINMSNHEAYIDNKKIHLTKKEYSILELLAMRKGFNTTKEFILNHLYSTCYDAPPQKIIDVFMCKLRARIISQIDLNHPNPDRDIAIIETVWGYGYSLRTVEGIHNIKKKLESKTKIK